MRASSKPTPAKSIRELLSGVNMSTEVNRYQFSVAAARRAREIHALTVDTEERSQQKSLLSAVIQMIDGRIEVISPDEEPID
jgi:DNA-directed RNA polymerase subunit K/omega